MLYHLRFQNNELDRSFCDRQNRSQWNRDLCGVSEPSSFEKGLSTNFAAARWGAFHLIFVSDTFGMPMFLVNTTHWRIYFSRDIYRQISHSLFPRFLFFGQSNCSKNCSNSNLRDRLLDEWWNTLGELTCPFCISAFCLVSIDWVE